MFPFGLHLAEAFEHAVGDEHRIIAEAVVAARRENSFQSVANPNCGAWRRPLGDPSGHRLREYYRVPPPFLSHAVTHACDKIAV
jgi:hypothetical protein